MISAQRKSSACIIYQMLLSTPTTGYYVDGVYREGDVVGSSPHTLNPYISATRDNNQYSSSSPRNMMSLCPEVRTSSNTLALVNYLVGLEEVMCLVQAQA